MSVLIGDAGGVCRKIKRRPGDDVILDGDSSLPPGVMSPNAGRRGDVGIRLRQFLIGDLGRRGAGIWVKFGGIMLDRPIGDRGNRCGIFVGVVTFSCSSSDARPRFDLNRLDDSVTSLVVACVTSLAATD